MSLKPWKPVTTTVRKCIHNRYYALIGLSEIANYIHDKVAKGESPSLLAFVSTNFNFIVENTKVGEGIADTWSWRFGTVARKLKADIVSVKGF